MLKETNAGGASGENHTDSEARVILALSLPTPVSWRTSCTSSGQAARRPQTSTGSTDYNVTVPLNQSEVIL